MTRLPIIGHSQVHSLGNFVSDQYHNFNLSSVVAEERYEGICGGRINHMLETDMIDKINSYSPQSIVMLIGDNDIRGTVSADTMANRIFSTAHSILLERCPSVGHVAIGHLLPRYPEAKGNAEAYNSTSQQVNAILISGANNHDNNILSSQPVYISK